MTQFPNHTLGRDRTRPGLLSVDGVEEALQEAMVVGRRAVEQARVVLAAFPAPVLSPTALDEGKRRVAAWNRLLGQPDEGLPPVCSPAAMRARLTAAWPADAKQPRELARLHRALNAFEADCWTKVSMPELAAGTKDTFHGYRAYALRAAREALAEAADELEVPGRLMTAEWTRRLARLRQALAIIGRYPPDPQGTRLNNKRPQTNSGVSMDMPTWADVKGVLDAHPEVGAPKRTTAKKRDLTALNRAEPAWRSKFWEQAVKTHKGHLPQIAAMMCCGCRPLELAHGVAVSLEGGQVKLTIEGAKVRNSPDDLRHDKGHPYRQVTVARNAPESKFLAAYIREVGNDTVVRFDYERKGPDGKPLPLDQQPNMKQVAGRWKDVVRDLAWKAMPKLKDKKLSVTPYTFRHAFSAGIKADGQLSDEQKAEAMGQLQLRTTMGYGGPQQAKKGKGPTVTSASAPKAVRGAYNRRFGPAGAAAAPRR